jgi:hypothetical protein
MVDLCGRHESCVIEIDGTLGSDLDVSSRDGCISLHLCCGTEACDCKGATLRWIEVNTVEPLPDAPEGCYVLAALDIDPDDATFDPAMEVSICYVPDELPAGMDEGNLAIAVLDEETGEWSFIGGTVDTDAQMVSFATEHLSVYGLLAVPAPTATPTTTTKAKQFAETDTAPSTGSGDGMGTGVWIGIIVALVLLLAIGVGLWLMKRNMLTFADLNDSVRDWFTNLRR